MADKLQVSIIGMGLIGASAGLALRRHADKILVVGHDRDPEKAGRAKQMGAVERTEWNLINTVARADRILIDLPLTEMRETLSVIANELRPGSVLLDTADVKVQVMQWAEELLPPTARLVGGHPIVLAGNPTLEGARADLFERALFCLTPSPRTDDTAVRLAADFVEALGGQPFFMDAVEHDGLVAGVEHLPMLIAGAMSGMLAGGVSWKEARKLGGGQYYTGNLVLSDTSDSAAASVLANREHTLRWLDQFQRDLEAWRGLVAAGDQEALAQAFDRGMVAWRLWQQTQASGEWEEKDAPVPVPTMGSYMRSLLGFGGPKPKENKRGKGK